MHSGTLCRLCPKAGCNRGMCVHTKNTTFRHSTEPLSASAACIPHHPQTVKGTPDTSTRITAVTVPQSGSGSISYSDSTTLRGEVRDGVFHEGTALRVHNGVLQEEHRVDGQRCESASQIEYENCIKN